MNIAESTLTTNVTFNSISFMIGSNTISSRQLLATKRSKLVRTKYVKNATIHEILHTLLTCELQS